MKNAEAGAHEGCCSVHPHLAPMVQHPQTLNHAVHVGRRLENCGTVPVLSRLCRMVQPWFLAQLEKLLQRPQTPAQHATMWREPSTMWKSWPLIGFCSATDFMENGAQHPPAEVGWRSFPPLWSIPPTTLSGTHKNITFGMDLTRERSTSSMPNCVFQSRRRPAKKDTLPQHFQLCRLL